MDRSIRKQRDRIFIAVEGEAEQAFVKYIQELAHQMQLFVHLDCQILSGGGYEKMLTEAVRQGKRRDRTVAKHSMLLVDSDRSNNRDDPWTVEQLQIAATKENFVVCLQNPNFEGLLLRLLSNKKIINYHDVKHQLRKLWPDYKKPEDAFNLNSRLSFNKLMRVAKIDNELKKLLDLIGLTNVKLRD